MFCLLCCVIMVEEIGMLDLMKGKCGLIMGVVNDYFIVWGIV